MMKHEAESKSNAYWLGLLAHLQSSSTPRKVRWRNNFICSVSNSGPDCFLPSRLTTTILFYFAYPGNVSIIVP